MGLKKYVEELFGKLIQYEKYEVNVVYLSYIYVLGGFFHEKSLPKLWKTILKIGLLIEIGYYFATSIPYLYTNLFVADSYQFDLMFVSMQTCSMPAGIGLAIGLGIYFRDKLKRSVHAIDAAFDIEWKVANSNEKSPSDYKKFDAYWTTRVILVFVLMSWLSTTLCRFIASFFLPDPHFATNNFSYWTIPTGGMENNDSFVVYTFFTVVSFFTFMLTEIRFFTFVSFAMLYGQALANDGIDVAHKIQAEGVHTVKVMESIERKINANEITDEQAEKLEIIESSRFGECCKEFVENCRKLREAPNNLKVFIELAFLATCSISFVYVPSAVFIALLPDSPISLKIAIAGYILPATILFFACCYFGKVLENLNDVIEQTAYALPWYYLKIPERRTIYLALAEFQQNHTELSAFGLYPVTMATFPRVMHLNYSIVNGLRTFQN